MPPEVTLKKMKKRKRSEAAPEKDDAVDNKPDIAKEDHVKNADEPPPKRKKVNGKTKKALKKAELAAALASIGGGAPPQDHAAGTSATKKNKTASSPEPAPVDTAKTTTTLPVEEPPATCSSTVYLSGLPYDWSEQDIQDLLTERGCKNSTEIRAPTWQDSGRLRGYCHIDFSKEKSAAAAVEKLSNHTLKSGRWLDCKIAFEKIDKQGTTNKLPKSRRVFLVSAVQLYCCAVESYLHDCPTVDVFVLLLKSFSSGSLVFCW